VPAGLLKYLREVSPLPNVPRQFTPTSLRRLPLMEDPGAKHATDIWLRSSCYLNTISTDWSIHPWASLDSQSPGNVPAMRVANLTLPTLRGVFGALKLKGGAIRGAS